MSKRLRVLVIAAGLLIATLAAVWLAATNERLASASDPVEATRTRPTMAAVERPPPAAREDAQPSIAAAPVAVPVAPPAHVRPAPISPATPSPAESPSPFSVAIPNHLRAEDPLVTDRMMDLKSTTTIAMGDDFDRVMDELSGQSMQSPLAKDLTALYSASATQASAVTDGVTVRAMACGLKLCLASLTASPAEAMTPWLGRLMSNPEARTYTLGMYDKSMPDGSIEYRLVFSIDPAISSSGVRSGE